MTGPQFPPDPDACPPRSTWVELVALTILNLMGASISVGIIAIPTLYCASFFATIGGVMFSDPLYFKEWGFVGWCGQLLDRHLVWFICYIAALIFGPLALGVIFRVLGLGGILYGARDKFGGFCSGIRYPGQLFVRISTGALFLPFVPTLFAAFAAFLIFLLALGMLGLFGLFEFGRFGGFRYLIMRAAVRDGVRDGLSRRRR